MSHFAVLVIGENVEAQLAPFHEFECTGEDDQYVQNVDLLPEAVAEYETGDKSETLAQFCEGWYGTAPLDGDAPDLAGPHKYGWMRATLEGGVTELVKRTNPNKQWDWYVVGGRFTGMFKMKPGRIGTLGVIGVPEHFASDERRTALAIERTVKSDSARKCDIDFESMRSEAGVRAGAKWDKINAVIAGRPTLAWSAVRDAHPGDIEAARVAFAAQPAVADIRKSTDDDIQWASFNGLDGWLVSREACVTAARDSAGVTFAVLLGGKWHERGSMGWFGCVSDEKDAGAWQAEFASLLDRLPDDTLLTVVDCHI